MRWLVWSLFAILIIPLASSENSIEPDANAPTIHFLIDQSLSMRDKRATLERELERVQASIPAEYPETSGPVHT